MNCEQSRETAGRQSLDELAPEQRQQLVTHLQVCRACRQTLVAADPTVVFSLLPTAEVSDEDVDRVRSGVHSLRRARALLSLAGRTRVALAAASLAAVLLASVLWLATARRSGQSAEVPFGNAIGVGSGWVELAASTGQASTVDLRLVLQRADRQTPVWTVDLQARDGESVRRELPGGYRLRFAVDHRAEGTLELDNFELVEMQQESEVSLLAADLRPLPDRPLRLGLASAADAETLRLTLVWRAAKGR